MNIKELVPEKVESEINSPDHPTRRFVGFALLFAWHYNLWFLHDSFVGAQLLDDCVTQSWLIALVSAAVSFIVIAFALGRKHRLCNIPWMLWIATAAAVISTLALTLFAFSFPTDLIAYALAAVVGITNAILWVMWGELYSRTKTSFSVSYIGTTVGLVTLVCSLICFVLPTGVSSVFIALMPLAAGLLFARGATIAKDMPYPTLLPKSTANRALKPMIVVCGTTFVASVACYFLVAIIPWENLPYGEYAFTFGSIGGATLLCIIGVICGLTNDRLNIYRTFPWLIIVAIASFALFLMGERFFVPSFFVVLAAVSIFEVLLIMYFGVLGVKGYVPIGFAFAKVATEPTSLLFVCVLAAVIIPLVRQEYNITQLMAPPATKSSQEHRIKELAAEFSLSARETEIVMLIARGFTTDNVAKKLVISPYTVNTHIRHVYEKVGIHKRSELIDYINRTGSEDDKA
ncbi:MAG: helix-turn-helix transcriptional regulator [Senegalimassilia anaerobia]|uniref:helix-turn-helix transcriptional regulator n=1 Tax=Senegalimassilia anaerobia TaxID=1473216 RepID=UPI002E77F801|nr:helix-turn-helix transcriptional regulator [Senegalimassilia anaerobia]MEE0303491.1 helix-turn-helix transcriptional regulator [Senegalimassilia anaerobia]